MRKTILLGLVFMFLLSSFVSADLTEDLISYYKLDETTGDVIDSHGTNDGTNNGATRGVTGIINNAFDFDGNNDYINLNSGSVSTDDLSLTNDFTICAWIKPDSVSGTFNILGKRNSDNYQFVFRIANGGISLLTTGGNIFYSTETITTGSFQYVCVTRDNDGDTIFYADGSSVYSESSLSISHINTNVRIGNDETGNFPFNGIIDEVGIWERVLSSDEISELYNSGNGLSYDNFAQDFQITAKDIYNDSSINTFNATITNSTDTIILSTTNGTIIWEYGDEDLLNITIEANNYFDRTYTDYNTTENLEARLHNLVITAKNSESGNSINNFFIIYNETTFSTNNGTLRTNLNYPSSEGGLFSFEVGATDYVNQNITNHQSNQTLEVSLFPANSLTINIFDAKTLDPIVDDFPYTLEGTKDFYTTGNVTNGSLVIQELEADDYELTFNKVGEYYPQTFYLRLQEGEAISIDAYFYDINTTLYSSVITIVDPNSQPIEAALVSIQERIQGNYRTISQKYTDSTGKVAFLLRPDADHKTIIEKTGFTTREYEIRPISDPYAVTLRINPELSYNYETAYDNVFFTYLPKIKQLNLSEHIFNLSLSSPMGELQYFGITTLYAATNITGSPAGGTAVLTADLSNHTSSTFAVKYFFKSIGRQEYSFTIVYPVSNIKPSSTSIIGIKEDSYLQGLSPLVKFIIIIATTIILLFVATEFGVPIQGAGIILTLVLTVAALIDWIPILLPITIGILTIGSFFMGNEQ